MIKKYLFLLFFISVFFNISFSQNLPYEEKVKYEKFLAQKIEDVIVKILGPNQAKILIETDMDFNKTEKVEYVKNNNEESFKFQNQSGDVSGIEYLMPGFGLPSNSNQNQSYNRELIFPSNFIKKIKLTILINKNLDENSVNDIKKIVSEIIQIKPERGDDITIVKADFAPIWKTVWYNPESMSFILKYIVLAFLGIISMIIIAIGFLKIAGAMSTMAKVQQTHNITMDLAGNPSTGLAQNPLINSSLNFSDLQMKGQGIEKKENEAEETGKIYFNILPHQIDALVSLMLKEDPQNVAIVVNHLPENVKDEFLKKLPLDFSSEVIAGLTKIRFIEQDVIYTLKDELETRIAGAIGGISDTISSFEKMSYAQRTLMIKNIEKKHPNVSYNIRKNILIFDDIYLLEEKDLSLLTSSSQLEDWSNVLNILENNFIEKLKSQFSQTAWKIIEEKNKYESPTEKRKEEAINNIMKILSKLIDEGRIKKPQIINNENLLEEKENSLIKEENPKE